LNSIDLVHISTSCTTSENRPKHIALISLLFKYTL